jgi:MFS family permease
MTRFLQGIGICMIQTACYSLTCVLFDDQKLKYMGFIQSCIGTGEVVGPFLGSCLFKYFGFFA